MTTKHETALLAARALGNEARDGTTIQAAPAAVASQLRNACTPILLAAASIDDVEALASVRQILDIADALEGVESTTTPPTTARSLRSCAVCGEPFDREDETRDTRAHDVCSDNCDEIARSRSE